VNGALFQQTSAKMGSESGEDDDLDMTNLLFFPQGKREHSRDGRVPYFTD
jgi:hypothetical protein